MISRFLECSERQLRTGMGRHRIRSQDAAGDCPLVQLILTLDCIVLNNRAATVHGVLAVSSIAWAPAMRKPLMPDATGLDSNVRPWDSFKHNGKLNFPAATLNILQIISGRGVNGALVYCKLLSEILARRGHQITILSRNGSWINSQPLAGDIDLIESTMKRFPDTELKRISSFVRDNRIDLIHTHMTRAHSFGVLLRMRTGIPVIATAHNRKMQLHWPFNDYVLANSQATYDYYRRFSRISASRMRTVYCFTDLHPFENVSSAQAAGIRRKHRLQDDFVIGVIGEVAPRKGQIHLFRALPELINQIPNLKVLLIGRFGRKQSYARQLRGYLRSQGLAGRVKWLGRRQNVASYMAACQLIAVPSVEEPLGLVALEAMAVGKPVVASRTGGLAEIILDEETGLSVEPADSSGLASAIIRLSSDQRLCDQLTLTAKRFVNENFSPEPLVDQVESVYQMVTRKHRAA